LSTCNERLREGDVDLIFLGDSITQGWEGAGKEVWEQLYGERRAVNLGFSGDRTQHVLWRLEHHPLKELAADGRRGPRLVVLMIGTNNSNGDDNTATEIGEGIRAIVTRLRQLLPRTKVLVLGIFPRGEKPDAQRAKNAEASALAAELADEEAVFYLDIGPRFLEGDGTLTREIMPDLLHLSPEGYRIWGEAIEPQVKRLMSED
jgi:beta-glucosidase